ncbi:alpha-1 2-mannosidase [Bacteroidota bacterium]|nr:alpha-1 2-mannosidase [Bacteroidota bacterium]
MKYFLIAALFAFHFSLFTSCSHKEKSPVDSVDPFIGTAGTGHTFPGACVPFGMVQLSPDTKTTGWEHCSGYHSDDSTIQGFSHTHLSGTGCGDLGDILFTPFLEGKNDSLIQQSFKHENEKADAGFYSVKFDNGIEVELTATERCGIHHYKFPEEKENVVLIDLVHGVNDNANKTFLQQKNDSTFVGYRFSSGWASYEKIFFASRFTKAISKIDSSNGRAILHFNSKEILIKVGISYTSIEGAEKNLEEEAVGKTFEAIKDSAKAKWQRALSKIEVKGGTEEQRSIFYTSLYHCMIHPSLEDDVDGRYRGMDDSIHTVETGHHQYHIFSLWDTYRALHPLMTIIDPKRDADFIRSLLNKFNESGRLPVWELCSNETDCMIGYHSIPVIADAFMKGIKDFDTTLALRAMIKSAIDTRSGLGYYQEKGYIPSDKENESVSKTLEYAYDDYCIARMAKQMNWNDTIVQKFYERSSYYQNLWNPEAKFFTARKYGKWISPFDPFEVNANYTEANAWQYLFAVAQDIPGLIQLMGGNENFEHKLDSLFTAHSELKGREQPDISGLLGQYAHGNEPSHHFAWLYNYIGKPAKSIDKVRYILNNFYHTGRNGLIGNDDCGQMSAWYVFSAMGFYPVCPASNYYAVGSPIFSEVKIHLDGNINFTIKADKLSEQNIYVSKSELKNRKEDFLPCFISHDDILNGEELKLTMSSSSTDSDTKTFLEKISNADRIIPVPYFKYDSRTFTDSMTIYMSDVSDSANVIYFGGDYFGKDSIYIHYNNFPIVIKNSKSIAVFAEHKNGKFIYPTSKNVDLNHLVESVDFKKISFQKTVTYKYPFSEQYTADGNMGLVDEVFGETNSFGAWQGFHGTDFEATVDLGATRTIKHIQTDWLNKRDAWIFNPTKVQYLISNDNTNWKEVFASDYLVEETNNNGIEISPSLNKPMSARYVKVFAKSIQKCPMWHLGNGEPSWLFIDEIQVD